MNTFLRLLRTAAAFLFAVELLGSSPPPVRGTAIPLGPAGLAPAANRHVRGAQPSYELETVANVRRLVKFSSQIHFIVVIVMENRSVDDLFAGYYGQPFPGGGTWDTALDLHNPSDPKTPLTANSLSAPFDPEHSHDGAFLVEASGNWSKEKFICPKHVCPKTATPYSYVPTMETDAYRQLVTNWAFANEVFEPNEGPSWPAHQYLIAGQAGGISGALTAPFAEAENPGTADASDLDVSEEQQDAPESPDVLRGQSSFCGPTKDVLRTLDMLDPYSQNERGNPRVAPCEEYGNNKLGTILDSAATRFGPPDYLAWQYVAHSTGSIWAAPLGVQHLFTAYESSKNKQTQPFAVDPGARQFVKDLGSKSPTRPFAHLTYLTPCYQQSDHPVPRGTSEGPEWLAYAVNAIGESKYWPHTAIIVTWDDWGGFYDHVAPFHPLPNAYPVAGSPSGNPSDPDEYGFRVPLMVVSPYIRRRAYVSTRRRSFSSILRYVESTFGMPSLNADDAYNDDLSDLFDLTRRPLPYIPITNVAAPKKSC